MAAQENPSVPQTQVPPTQVPVPAQTLPVQQGQKLTVAEAAGAQRADAQPLPRKRKERSDKGVPRGKRKTKEEEQRDMAQYVMEQLRSAGHLNQQQKQEERKEEKPKEVMNKPAEEKKSVVAPTPATALPSAQAPIPNDVSQNRHPPTVESANMDVREALRLLRQRASRGPSRTPAPPVAPAAPSPRPAPAQSDWQATYQHSRRPQQPAARHSIQDTETLPPRPTSFGAHPDRNFMIQQSQRPAGRQLNYEVF